MSLIADLHAYEQRYSLNGNGYVVFKIFVLKKIKTINLQSVPTYLIRTALKVSIYNKQQFSIAPGPLVKYANYPALFSFQKALRCPVESEAANFQLLNYSPKTVNSSITTSRSDSSGDVLTTSAQLSLGSSTSQTNSFGVNVQAGIMGELPMFGVGLSYDYAYTSGQSQERTRASSDTRERQTSDADSFSIKDWGIYASVDQDAQTTTWVCAQEYPWNVLEFRSQNGQGNIDLPQAITDRMLIGDCVLPPSQLSQFGTDFTFTADWGFSPDELNVDVNTPLFSVAVTTSYVLGTHQRTGSGPTYDLAVSLSQAATNNNALTLTWGQLECLALDAVMPGRNDSSINFEKLPASRFPSVTSSPLTVTAPTNTLFCMTAGFAPGMVADIAKGPVTYTLKFKVTDTVGELSLYIKHWKLDQAGLVLNINVNGCDLPEQYVDALQGNGGTGNRTAISLRTTDYMDEDFTDYLVVGLNTVTVTVALNATPPPPSARYCLSAVVVT